MGRYLLMNRLALVLGLLLTACTGALSSRGPTQTSSTTVTKDYSYTGGPFQKLLVVVVLKEVELKQKFESTVARMLEDVGITAMESFKIVPAGQELTREMVKQQIDDTQIDGVLAVRLVGAGIEIQETAKTPGTEVESLQYSDRLGGRSLWADSSAAYQPVRIPGYALEQNMVQTDSALYEVEQGGRVWNASRKATFTGDRNSTINQIGSMIVKELQTAGLI